MCQHAETLQCGLECDVECLEGVSGGCDVLLPSLPRELFLAKFSTKVMRALVVVQRPPQPGPRPQPSASALVTMSASQFCSSPIVFFLDCVARSVAPRLCARLQAAGVLIGPALLQLWGAADVVPLEHMLRAMRLADGQEAASPCEGSPQELLQRVTLHLAACTAALPEARVVALAAAHRLVLHHSILRLAGCNRVAWRRLPPTPLPPVLPRAPASLADYDWIGFDLDHTLIQFKRDAFNGRLFAAAARHLIEHGSNQAKMYSVTDSAGGSLLMGDRLVGNRFSQFRALLVAALLTGEEEEDGAGEGVVPSTAGGVAAAPYSMDFNLLVALSNDSKLCADVASGVPFWGHLASSGVVLDMPRGNLLWLDAAGSVYHALHGRTALTPVELEATYGPRGRWLRGYIDLPPPVPPPVSPARQARPRPPQAPLDATATTVVASPVSADSRAEDAAAALAILVSPVEHAEQEAEREEGEGTPDDVKEARAKLRDVVATTLPQGPFYRSPITTSSTNGKGGAASTAAANASAKPRYGSTFTGFDEIVPPLVALLVSRYDAWLARNGNGIALTLHSLEAQAAKLEAVLQSPDGGGMASSPSQPLPPLDGVSNSTSSSGSDSPPSSSSPSPAVDYTFISDSVQAAYRFVYSAYCSFGFGSLLKDGKALDAALQKHPKTRSLLTALRRLPLPALPLPTAQLPSPPALSQRAGVSAAGGGPVRTRRLRTFLLTNSSLDHASSCLKHALGADWLDLFDAVFVDAQKRRLFQDTVAGCAGDIGGGNSATDSGDGVPSSSTPALRPPVSVASGGAAGAVAGRRPSSGGGGGNSVAPAAPLVGADSSSQGALGEGGHGRPSNVTIITGSVADLARTKVWSAASLRDLHATLASYAYAGTCEAGGGRAASTAAEPPDLPAARVLYFGDHILHDVIGPAVAAGWDTIAVMPAIAALASAAALPFSPAAAAACHDNRPWHAASEEGAGRAGFSSHVALQRARVVAAVLGEYCGGGGDVSGSSNSSSGSGGDSSGLKGGASAAAALMEEYTIRSLGVDVGLTTPSLVAALTTRYAAAAVPSIDWLSDAMLPALVAAQTAADRSGASRAPLLPLRVTVAVTSTTSSNGVSGALRRIALPNRHPLHTTAGESPTCLQQNAPPQPLLGQGEENGESACSDGAASTSTFRDAAAVTSGMNAMYVTEPARRLSAGATSLQQQQQQQQVDGTRRMSTTSSMMMSVGGCSSVASTSGAHSTLTTHWLAGVRRGEGEPGGGVPSEQDVVSLALAAAATSLTIGPALLRSAFKLARPAAIVRTQAAALMAAASSSHAGGNGGLNVTLSKSMGAISSRVEGGDLASEWGAADRVVRSAIAAMAAAANTTSSSPSKPPMVFDATTDLGRVWGGLLKTQSSSPAAAGSSVIAADSSSSGVEARRDASALRAASRTGAEGGAGSVGGASTQRTRTSSADLIGYQSAGGSGGCCGAWGKGSNGVALPPQPVPSVLQPQYPFPNDVRTGTGSNHAVIGGGGVPSNVLVQDRAHTTATDSLAYLAARRSVFLLVTSADPADTPPVFDDVPTGAVPADVPTSAVPTSAVPTSAADNESSTVRDSGHIVPAAAGPKSLTSPNLIPTPPQPPPPPQLLQPSLVTLHQHLYECMGVSPSCGRCGSGVNIAAGSGSSSSSNGRSWAGTNEKGWSDWNSLKGVVGGRGGRGGVGIIAISDEGCLDCDLAWAMAGASAVTSTSTEGGAVRV